MSYERRYNERLSLKHDVVIYCGHLGLIRGKIGNISADGMFIATGRVRLNVNADVEVCLSVGGARGRELHRLNAQVVRIEKDGLGLKFTQQYSAPGLLAQPPAGVAS